MNTYRYVTGSLIVNTDCTASEFSKVFGVGVRNFERYAKRYREGGADAFFKPSDQRGRCYKMTAEKLEKAQKLPDLNYSQMKIAREINVNEASIRYHLKNGNLKKRIN